MYSSSTWSTSGSPRASAATNPAARRALVSAPESASEQPHLEEERRLMYVALPARAAWSVLFFCRALGEYGSGSDRNFLSELGFKAPVVSGQGGLAIHGTNGQAARSLILGRPNSPYPIRSAFTQLAAFPDLPLAV